MSVAVLRGDSVLLARGYGFANLDHRVPATDSTIYQSGSVGKQFTSAAIVTLAREGKIVGLFLRRGMVPVLLGAVAGVCVALVGGRIMSSLVFGIAPTDPVAILGAVASFTLIALAAILVATRGAARTDPMTVLRAE
jgi:hypothetical protein